ncbi:glycine--tRNA ligase subunit beta [Thermatribacter velox]|uniref:Glycine--tRNA ligase beta subunit n=1 Tax=Thermatribacter velox TaxID=3039681 RepID=A0ABZ2Y9Z0_9BACT
MSSSGKTLLVEVGMEELPSSLKEEVFEKFEEVFLDVLRSEQIIFGEHKVLGTPRRVTILLHGVEEFQRKQVLEVKGPPKKVALSPEGEWLKPALLFAQAQGVEPSSLFIKEAERGTYVFARKEIPGKAIKEILPQVLKKALSCLQFSRSMRWGEGNVAFVRPIRWLVALLDDEEIVFEFADITSSKFSRGHRFLCPGKVAISSAETYLDTLRKAFVIADPQERRAKIEELLTSCAQEEGIFWLRDENLLEEVNFLVEYPGVGVGRFEEKYLTLPSKVLITVMKHHQRYFACTDERGNLSPHFMVVLNRPADGSEIIIKGNERVLRARLEDALFFFHEDRRSSLSDKVDKLKGVVFQESLGTMWEKTQRLIQLSRYLAQKLHVGKEKAQFLERAAFLAKADLACEMVKEFPELQGYMGRVYAQEDGEAEEVALAIEEQYFSPSEGNYPKTLVGSVLSLVDRVDTIVSSFALERIPSGSEDPLGLRRLAQGLIGLIINKCWFLGIKELIRENLSLIAEQGFVSFDEAVVEKVLAFLLTRLRTFLLEQGINYSIINAVLGIPIDDIYEVYLRASALQKLWDAEKSVLEAVLTGFTRAYNISKNFDGSANVDEQLLQEEIEREFYQSLLRFEKNFESSLKEGNYQKLFEDFYTLVPVLDRFFEKVLVMAPEEAIRKNRLALMKKIVLLWHRFADLSQVVIQEENGGS